MKKLILFFVLITNYSFTQWVFDNVPAPKIQDDGKCVVFYQVNDEYQYLPNTKFIDWHKSCRKIESLEAIKSDKLYMIEKYRTNDGVREGKYELKVMQPSKLSSGSLTLNLLLDAEFGEYIDGKLNGKVIRYYSWKGSESFVQLNYKNGLITDSIIKLPSVEIELYKDSKSNTHKVTLQPYIKFQKGKVIESLFLDEKKFPCLYFGKYDNTFSYLRYTNYPISANYFSYDNNAERSEKNQDISIECYSVKNESENSNLYHGNYRRFSINSDVLFDTTLFVEDIYFLEGKRSGISNIWGNGKNGRTDSPWAIYNFENDLLEGKSMFFYKGGKVYVSANFSQGKLFGEAVVYSFGNRKEERKLKQKISYQNQFPITSLWEILEKHPSDSYEEEQQKLDPVYLTKRNIPGTNLIEKYINDLDFIRKKGGVIDEFDGYEEYMKINYRYNSSIGMSVPSEDINIYNNGKVMVKYEIDPNLSGNVINAIWYDNNSNEVFDNKNYLEQLSQIKQKELEAKKEVESALNNSIVKCDWCKKEYKFGEGEYLETCNCTRKDNSQSAYVYLRNLKTFCSKDCRSKYDKDCCIRNGYKYE